MDTRLPPADLSNRSPKYTFPMGTQHPPVELLSVASLSALPAAIRGTRPFVLLLLMDADEVYSGEIELTAARLLNQGLAYFGAWGPDCVRVRTVFEAAFERQQDAMVDDLPMVSYVSHEDDNLEDTLWEFLNIYFPGEEFENPRWIAAVVKDKKLAARVSSLLSDAVPAPPA